MCNDFASLLVRNSEFYNNITNQVNGGAISAGTSPNGTNSRVMISNSSFHNNRAVEGGALYFGNCSKVLVENSKFFYNSALKGGAMVLSDTTIVRNCQIFTNQAQDGGAGIYIENGNNLILNCTISSNCSQSYGGGVYITNVTTTKEHTAIINSIVMGNNCSAATTKDIYGLECDPSGTRYYAYSRIGGFADCKYTSAYAVTDENPLMYFSSEDFQFNLRYYSTCIDGGAPLPFYIYGQDKTLFEEDINRQLSGNFYDIGAIEYIDPPDLEVYTPELKFGQVAIGDTIYQDLRISNRGYLNSLQIESITLPEGFTFVDNASRSNEPGINVPKVKPGKVIDSVSTIRKTSSSKGKNSLTKDATLTSQIDKKTNQNSNKRSISFPLTIDPFETLDLKVQFIPTQSKDYNCIINIVSSGIAEPAAIQISAVGFDDTEHIYDEKVWSDDTLFVSTNIYVHDGAKLTIAPYTTVKYLKNKTITIEGHFVVEDSVRFTTSPGVTNARLFLNKPQRCPIYEYTFHNTSFNNIKLEALSSRGVIEGAHFLNSTLTHEGDYLEINNSAFNFSNVDVFGKGKENDVVRIIRNTFNYTPYNSLISINSYYGFVIAENTLTNYQTALWINESGKGPDHIIAKNTICYNQYGYGIELYHTTADIIDANNINNNYVGIAGLRNSTINIKGSKEEPFQTIHNNYDAELVFAEDSAPVYMDFNLIFDQLYPGQNLLRITNHTGKEFKYNNNYWGPNFNPEVNLNPFGFIHFEPIWDLKPEYLEQYDAVEELYNSASNNYTVGNYLLAFNQFKQVIDIAGEGHDKLVKAAAEQLIGLAVLIEEPYSSLQQYYINEPHLHYKEEFDLLAKYLENCCKIKVGDYEGAINWFESIISNPPSQIDSVYAVIDMAYTYLLMQDDSKYQGFVGKYPQYRYTRYEDFLNMRENLVQDILSKSESHLTPPIITTTLDQNYPNPFNPITTICYSLSKGSKCNLAIYNIKGQKVKELVSTSKSKGKYRVIWDGKDDSGKQVSSGIYFYRLDTKDKVITRKMILMK
jgi:tetratricopeptide (TPR) repeat protein